MKKGKLEKVVQTGLKAAGVAVAGVVLAIGLSGCPEPKTEYRDRVICEDPTHGEHCPGEHIEDHDCVAGCGHSIPKCEYPTVKDCYTALTGSMSRVRSGVEGVAPGVYYNCMEKGCKSPQKCLDNINIAFTNMAFDYITNNGGSVHNVAGLAASVGSANHVKRGDYAPCVTTNEHTAIGNATRAKINDFHTF